MQPNSICVGIGIGQCKHTISVNATRVRDTVQNKDQNTVTHIEAQTLSVNAASH